MVSREHHAQYIFSLFFVYLCRRKSSNYLEALNSIHLLASQSLKNTSIYSLIFIVLSALSACKKESIPNTPKPIAEKILSDSISFGINGKQYIFNNLYGAGFGNRQVNIKQSPVIIADRQPAYITGGYYWYGEKDSTLYSAFYKLNADKQQGDLQVSFSKKFRNTQLIVDQQFLKIKDYFSLLRFGKQTFSVDLDKENSMDGIAIDFNNSNLSGNLSTTIPGFSILVRSNLGKNIQDNSLFEITKIEKLEGNQYLIEANFEVNLYDKNEQLYRAKNGFLRITTDRLFSSIAQ